MPRESIISKETVRGFLRALDVDPFEIDRICEGLLHDLPVRDVLDQIVELCDDVFDEADAAERLTLCAAAEDARARSLAICPPGKRHLDLSEGDFGAVRALDEIESAHLKAAGIDPRRWEEARNAS